MPEKSAAIVYPHQLWARHPAVEAADHVYLVEDPLYFSQFNFHVQKLVLQRAAMTEFADRCRDQGKSVRTIEAKEIPNSSGIGELLRRESVKQAHIVELTDDWLTKSVISGCQRAGVQVDWLPDPAFLTPEEVLNRWSGREHYHFTSFYIEQRKRLSLLLDAAGKPVGGKWTFDTENRKKLPRGLTVPEVPQPSERPSVTAAKRYVASAFPNAIGHVNAFCYPVTHHDASVWLNNFVHQRLAQFGDFEDAISSQQTFLFHGVLTPMLNIGLLTPQQVIDAALAHNDDVPLNSLEGFLRQVIGWREFVRLIYLHVGGQQRTTNAWNLTRPLPEAFYTGSTGILPVDDSIERCLKHAYCHHIERLMVLGNFMLLCDVAPNAIYQWFMELFIDAFDWVMVPNVYGMSQHADGGLMTTKPYISGSAYVRKMSDYRQGEWCPIWDALYWRFIDREREFFNSNPRMRVMVSQLNRMGAKLDQHRQTADRYLEQLHG